MNLNAFSEWITKVTGHRPLATDRLVGDGSNRTFYRVRCENSSYILLWDAQWKQTQDYPAHQAFLLSKQIPVPKFFSWDPAAGFLLMEDLGDELLQERILKSPSQRDGWLEGTVTLLADLHGRTYPVPAELPVSHRRFDKEKYTEELKFTWTHLHQGLLGLPGDFPEREARAYTRTLEAISPWAFSHRDFHTRNLLLHREHLALIDFQDARLGPPHYDLASFLFDPYVPLDTAQREKLKALYHARLNDYALASEVNWEAFTPDLEAIAWQRLVKAAGSFASFYTRFQKDTHLRYLRPALETAAQLSDRDFFPLELWQKTWKKHPLSR